MPPEEPAGPRPELFPPKDRRVVSLPRSRLFPHPANPREFDNLKPAELADLLALADSLMADGQKQPLRVAASGPDEFTIVSGHRRWYAAGLRGIQTLSCEVLPSFPSEPEFLVDQLVENGQHEDFSDVAKMEAYQRLMRLQGWTPKQLAAAVHVSEGQVSRVLTLKRLCPEVQALVRDGSLKGTLAYQIARVGVPERQKELAAQVQAGMTREVLEVRVRELLKGGPRRQPRPPVITVPFTGLESTAKALSAHADEMRAAAKRGFTDDDYALKLRKRGKA